MPTVESNQPDRAMNTPSASGGGSLALDMDNERDRGAVRTAAKRWSRRFAKMDEAKQDQLVELLDKARARAEMLTPDDHTSELDIIKAMDSIVKTGVAIVTVQQRDDHALLSHEKPNPGTTINLGVAVQNNLPSNDPSLMREIVSMRARLAERDMADTVHRPALNGNGNGAGH